MERNSFPVFYPISTRWMDNDVYGHVNNVTYYSYFDSAINRYLIEEGGLDIHNGSVVGFVVSSNCQFRKPVAYPDVLEAGLRVVKTGNSSVTYEVGIFKQGDNQVSAVGQVVHVFVDRESNASTPIPGDLRSALERVSQA